MRRIFCSALGGLRASKRVYIDVHDRSERATNDAMDKKDKHGSVAQLVRAHP